MTNVNAPFGLRPVRRLDAAAVSFQAEPMQIAYNNATQIATGSLVKLLNTGYISLYDNGDTRCAGVFIGCSYPDPNNNRQTIWRPMWNAVGGLASTDIVTAWVLRDRNIVFEVQAGAAGCPFANIQTNVDLVVGTPNSTTGRATSYLDSTFTTTATLPLRVIGMGQGVQTTDQAGTTNGYDATTGYNIVQVILNTLDTFSQTGV